jgi:hypothetical protein
MSTITFVLFIYIFQRAFIKFNTGYMEHFKAIKDFEFSLTPKTVHLGNHSIGSEDLVIKVEREGFDNHKNRWAVFRAYIVDNEHKI